MSVHKKPDGTWYVHWRDELENRHTKTFGKGIAAKREAQAFDHQIKAQKKLKQTTIPQSKSKIYIDELSQAYVDHCRANGKDGKWLKDLIKLLNDHWIPRLIHKPVDELTYQDMTEFIKSYNHTKQITRNRYFDYLKVIFNYGINHGMTKNNPLATWKKGKELPRQTLLTINDLMKIYNNAAPHLQWCMEVVWFTGIRPGPKELFSLTWNKVNFDSNIIKVLGKGNLWRDVPLSDSFRKRLLEKKTESISEHLIEYNGQPVKQMRRSLKTAVSKAGLTYQVCMYSIRHLFASVLLSRGADLAAVSKLLGHTSTKMTADQYYHLLSGEKKRAVELIPDLPHKGSEMNSQKTPEEEFPKDPR